jgi:hypothetical protein
MRHLVIGAMLAAVVSLVGCQPAPPGPDGILLRGSALAGPTCPVERDPPDPACAERPVAGAEVRVLAVESGAEVARVTTDADGAFDVELPPGRYRLVAQPVAGLMAAPAPLEVVLAAEQSPEPVVLAYDTGIR